LFAFLFYLLYDYGCCLLLFFFYKPFISGSSVIPTAQVSTFRLSTFKYYAWYSK